ncbi:major strawberry allergen Fra a 1-2-like [Mangifera indica]|uniref:major strawberry allergen Fra a 1-2-like n=1 Tax=Mangifera indica TaxID=29780 RepID=UPI001CFB04EB|nr:major strawberry allergen Fra a 1-2-like [Mangifera indica]
MYIKKTSISLISHHYNFPRTNQPSFFSFQYFINIKIIMGVFTYEMEVITKIPPVKIFNALILDGDKLIPKIVPQAIKTVELIEGDGGPGSIKKITFGEGSQFDYVKHKVEALDKENFIYSYSVIEGDALMKSLEKITYEIKLASSADGGSICKSISKYYTIGNFAITEEQIKAGKEKSSGLFKATEAYLLANPDAY